MDIVYAAAMMAGAAFLFATSNTARKADFSLDVPELETKIYPRNLEVRQCRAVDEIRDLLARNGKQNEVLLDSMNLMLYQIAHPDINLNQLVPEDGAHIIETGRNYLSRFTEVSGVVFYFLAGVIEHEVENIRLDVNVTYQDKQSVRKLVDIFYYKEIKMFD